MLHSLQESIITAVSENGKCYVTRFLECDWGLSRMRVYAKLVIVLSVSQYFLHCIHEPLMCYYVSYRSCDQVIEASIKANSLQGGDAKLRVF